jgi:hypothetical protein
MRARALSATVLFRTMSSQRSQQTAFEVLSDDEGSLTLGWVAEDVLYTRVAGGLSSAVGMAHAARLRGLLAGVSSLRYFGDFSALSRYELLARSAFARLILENRRKFAGLVLLSGPASSALAGEAFAAAVGEPITRLTDAREFEQCLLLAAPLAKQRLDPRMWDKLPASSAGAERLGV